MKQHELTKASRTLAKDANDEREFRNVVDRLAQARIVMLGEASHGTKEFYTWRSRISQKLIQEHGFNVIAVEGDWPDASKIDNYIQKSSASSALEVLNTFHRWPTWMWANQEVAEFTEWLCNFNRNQEQRVNFYGLDIYSLFESIDSVLEYLKKEHPFLARRIQENYSCFDTYHRDEIAYAKATLRIPEGCHDQVMENLMMLLELRIQDTSSLDMKLFHARQNALIIRNAENYYRSMMRADVNSWNIRDRHMTDTLDMLLEHHGSKSKAIIWAHNTHIGDYRATDMVDEGSVNLGGLARERYGAENVALLGFGTYRGSVIAAHAWDGQHQVMRVPPARLGSYEAVFHGICEELGKKELLFLFDENQRKTVLGERHGHRAIGVVYAAEYEGRGNYVPTAIANRYDAFVFIDETRALEPLRVSFEHHQIPETWPTGQ